MKKEELISFEDFKKEELQDEEVAAYCLHRTMEEIKFELILCRNMLWVNLVLSAAILWKVY